MTTLQFQDVAEQIIKNSIQSAIFVDEKITGIIATGIDDLSLGLYQSFQENNCSLDFYKFDKTTYETKLDFITKKDLLLLDWKLDEAVNPDDLSFALKILEKAVNTPSLHFCCVYTNETDLFNSVLVPIVQYFSDFDTQNVTNKKEELENFHTLIGVSDEDLSENINQIKAIAREFILNSNQDKKGVAKDLFTKLRDKLNLKGKQIGELQSIIKSLCSNNIIGLLNFALIDEVIETIAPNSNNYEINVHGMSNTIHINGTIIRFESKTKINGVNFYDDFKKAITESNYNFFVLLSLEMRNMFRKSSSFIGKDVIGISDLALFYHEESFEENKDEFYEFLKNVWKEQASSFLLTESPNLFDAIPDYKSSKGIEDDSIKNFDDINSLVKLNILYNQIQLNPERKTDDKIRFGDIFLVEEDKKDNPKAYYILCITPHCDCLRPEEKIENNYFFVKGNGVHPSKENMKSLESKYTSFVKYNQEDFVIEWKNKPFSIHLAQNTIATVTDNKALIVNKNEFVILNYIGTIKENYAQRIANNAFSYPLRVGINFAEMKSENK